MSYSTKKMLFILVSGVSISLGFINFLRLSRDMIYGDFSAVNIIPPVMYRFLRVPDLPYAKEHNAVNRLAADYTQIYFPAQEFSSLKKNYQTGYLDPWKRPSRIAPFVHALCAISICKLDYGYSSFLHMLIQMLLFYPFFFMSFKMLGVESDRWFGILFTSVCLFATPAGMSWFERGQYSLYVALAYLLVLLGLLKNKPMLVVASALFADLKWTALPFLFVVIFVYWLSAKNTKEQIQNTRTALIYLVVLLIPSLPFWSTFIEFLEGLYKQESYGVPVGVSLIQLLPRAVVKGLPVLLILIGYLSLRRNGKNLVDLIPFFVGSGILLLTYPTVAYEYNIPNLFCFIPLIAYWVKQNAVNPAIKYLLFGFVFLASFVVSPYVNTVVILMGYLSVSAVFLVLGMTRFSGGRRLTDDQVISFAGSSQNAISET